MRCKSDMLDHPLLILLVLALPIASISWTITHEPVFLELREWLDARSAHARSLWGRKFFFLFTCEFCLSHWVTLGFLIITRYTLLFEDWRGYLISGFSLVWVANVYMGLFGRLRLDIKREKVEIAAEEAAQKQPPDSEGDGAQRLQRAQHKPVTRN
jgi:hypothetical protein